MNTATESTDEVLYTYGALLGAHGRAKQRETWDRARAVCIDLQCLIPDHDAFRASPKELERLRKFFPATLNATTLRCWRAPAAGNNDRGEWVEVDVDIDLGCVVCGDAE